MKMYSGSDSTESQNYTQWALNPTAYQNVSSENVDWAALAQQWIIMKEAGPPVPEQTPPPPPNISNKLRKDNLNEGGEAPMDVENDKEEEAPDVHWNEGSGGPPGDSWNWNQQSQWGWNNTWTPSGVPPPNTIKPPLLPTPSTYNQFSSSTDVQNEGGNFGGYNSVPPNDFSSGYWTAAGSSKMKQHNKRYNKVNIQRTPPAPEPITLDAAKRKQLPAWIREGLEKMERDKQKQLEREREKQDKEEFVDKIKLSEKDTMEIIKNTVKEQQKGKFESDDDYSDDEKNTKSTFVAEPAPLTQEELMLKVRRTMTEILLNVTNHEIHSVCKEELQRYVKKMKASDDRVSAPSGTNLSAKLGLGMYGDSGSSSDESDAELQQECRDSDAELKDIIRKKKAEFSKIEREIEDRLAEVDRHTGDESKPGTPEVTDNDTQVDAKLQGRNKSRFNNSNNEHTPPPKQVQTTKRKSYRSSSCTSQSGSDSERKNSRNYKSKRHRRTDSSDSSSGKHKSWRSRSSSLEYRKLKHKDEVGGSKSSSSQSRRSRSKSPRSRRSRSRSKSFKRRYSKRSRSRSRRSRSRRSNSRSNYKSTRSRRSRSRSRSRSYSRSHRRSRSRRRSSSSSHRSHRKRRSPSSGSIRGKRSHRH